MAVADVGEVLTFRVSLLVFVKAELGFLELALVEPAQGVHVHCLFPRKGALVLLKELVEGDAGLVPIDVGKVTTGDAEFDFLQRGWIDFLHVGLGPIVVADGFFVFFAVLGNRTKDDGHHGDLFGVRVLSQELLALRLGLAVAADFAEGEDVVVVSARDLGEVWVVFEDITEGHEGFPWALELEEAEADAVRYESVVVRVLFEFALDGLEAFQLSPGLLDLLGGLRCRLGIVLHDLV